MFLLQIVAMFALGLPFLMLFNSLRTLVNSQPSSNGIRPNYRQAISRAFFWNAIAIAVFFLNFMGAIFVSPILSFSIAIMVATAAGRWATVFGSIGSSWFLVPLQCYAIRTYSLDQWQAYGNPIFDRFSMVTYVGGITGALLVELVWAFQRRRLTF